MKLGKEEDVRFEVRHLVTEEKLLHLEKGVRKLGFLSGGKRIMTILAVLFILCMAVRVFAGGVIGDAMSVIGTLCAISIVFGGYALIKAWLDAKKQIHLQFKNGEMEGKCEWTYRFLEDCYEIIGKNETARVQYSNVCRFLDFSGMYVLVERGSVVRYFMKDDTKKGDGDSLAGFLKEKCGVEIESVPVR